MGLHAMVNRGGREEIERLVMGDEKLRVFAGNSNMELSRKIVEILEVSLGDAVVKRFSDGEINVEIDESVRGMDVFVIQSICRPVNENLMELLILIDAFKRASPRRITAVMPYYGYARQDRKVSPRAPITAKLVADLITTAGASRILTVELHAGQIQGFFNIPVDHLYSSPVMVDHMKEEFENDTVVVSPDAGGVERARAFAKHMKASLAIIDKRRDSPNVSRVMNVIGDVKGKVAILVDDMVDTAGTLVHAAEALQENGAYHVYACCVHPILSGSAVERISDSPIEKLVVSDTIPLKGAARKCEKIIVISLANLLAEAIRRIHHEASVSELFI
jgi:ribose-phosphate pyrophosphokinase